MKIVRDVPRVSLLKFHWVSGVVECWTNSLDRSLPGRGDYTHPCLSPRWQTSFLCDRGAQDLSGRTPERIRDVWRVEDVVEILERRRKFVNDTLPNESWTCSCRTGHLFRYVCILT